MRLDSLEIKGLNKKLQNITDNTISAEAYVETYNRWDSAYRRYQSKVRCTVIDPVFNNVAAMHAFSKTIDIPLEYSLEDEDKSLDLKRSLDIHVGNNCSVHLNSQNSRGVPTVKLIPSTISADAVPHLIVKDVPEYTENGETYRFLFGPNHTYSTQIKLIARHDDVIYDYLDKGFLYMDLSEDNDKPKSLLISNSYDLHTAHIFLMCRLDPVLAKMTQDGCFINKADAEILRFKMFRKLIGHAKEQYDKLSKDIDNDYKKNSTALVIGKLASGEIPKTSLRDIAFTKTSAVYNNVSIEAEDLLELTQKHIDFNGEFDIYAICNVYATYMHNQINCALGFLSTDDPSVRKSLPTIKINNIPITVSKSFKGQRYINGIRINQDEILQAVYRASCHRSEEDYKLFLKSISSMSIKRHDIIANGLQVKVHDSITPTEYRSETPSEHAPAIKFYIDDSKNVNLQINKDRKIRVKLGTFIKKVESINKRTNNKSSYSGVNGWRIRNNYWAAERVVEALIECTTFKEEVKDENGTVTEVDKVYITKQDVQDLLAQVGEQTRAKIERSKQFLASAVKTTGATKITFMGQEAYKVQGSLRTYAVVIKNAKVYDFDTQQYRCIVNDNHYKGAGYDDIASRLLALKNDSVMTQAIRTLQGSAQPGAEHAHRYTPEREDGIASLDGVIDSFFTPKTQEVQPA